MASQIQSKHVHMIITASVLALFLSIRSVNAVAQTPPAAPVPSDFASAQTVFIANAGAPVLGAKERVAVAMMYNSLYLQLNIWNKYKLLAGPTDADLLFEISIATEVSDATNGTSFSYPHLKLDTRDRKTHALLWTADESLKGAFREKTFRRNVDEAVSALIEDLKALAIGKQPGYKTDSSQGAVSPVVEQNQKP